MENNLANLFSGLEISNSGKYIKIELEELLLSSIKNYNLISEYFILIDTINKMLSIGTIFCNKQMICGLLRLRWIYDKIILGILSVSSNYHDDISLNKLDKFTPENYLSFLKSNLSNEHYQIIETNYNFYVNKFSL
jgi:hypothetical protein